MTEMYRAIILLDMSETRLTFRSDPARKMFQNLEQITQENRVGPGEFIASEVELTRKYKISRMTVRRVVENLINRGLIERRAGQGLFAPTEPVAVGLVEVVISAPFSDISVKVARGAKEFGREHGIDVLIRDAGGHLETEIELVSELPDSKADGAIIMSAHHPKFAQDITKLYHAGYPFVLIDEAPHYLDVNSVVSDNYAGGYFTGKELLRLGHRRIGFVGNLDIPTIRQRFEGMRDAVLDAGLPFNRKFVVNWETNGEGVFQDFHQQVRLVVRRVMSMPNRPSALFFFCDHAVSDGYMELLSMGLRIGKDVSVVGFDDSEQWTQLDPPVASVRQESVEMGKVAMELLIRRMRDPQAPTEHRVLPTKWVPRASVGPAPSE